MPGGGTEYCGYFFEWWQGSGAPDRNSKKSLIFNIMLDIFSVYGYISQFAEC
jgi:hypothetical protein